MRAPLLEFLFLSVIQYYVSADPPSSLDYQCGWSTVGWKIPPSLKDATLKQVIAIIRHGDRTAYSGSQCWPGDTAVWNCDLVHGGMPVLISGGLSQSSKIRVYDKIFMASDEILNGSCSVGQLTSLGYKQHLLNGEALKDAYVNSGFLKPTLDPSEVFIRSDNFPRTVLSAQSLILGMFPPDDNTPLHVPLYTRDLLYDYIEANANLCPKYGLYKHQFYESKVWMDHQVYFHDLINEVNKAVGFDIGTDLGHFGDCLMTHLCHNHSWPNGMTQDLYNKVIGEVTWESYSTHKYPSVAEMARVGIGFLLKDIWKNFKNSISGNVDHKFRLYSGHDTTTLEIDHNVWPPYGSMMIFELYNASDSKAFVRLMYNGDTVSPPFCCGSEMCEFDSYSKYFSTVTPPDNYNEFCSSSLP